MAKRRRKAPAVAIEGTDLYTWFERDRAHVELRHRDTDETLIEFWDEDDDGRCSPLRGRPPDR